MADRVRQELATDNLVTTVISLFELTGGVETERDRAAVEALFGSILVLPVEREAAELAGQVDHALRKQGQRVAEADMLIAGVALQHGMSVLTKNVRHFGRIPGLRLEPV